MFDQLMLEELQRGVAALVRIAEALEKLSATATVETSGDGAPTVDEVLHRVAAIVRTK